MSLLRSITDGLRTLVRKEEARRTAFRPPMPRGALDETARGAADALRLRALKVTDTSISSSSLPRIAIIRSSVKRAAHNFRAFDPNMSRSLLSAARRRMASPSE